MSHRPHQIGKQAIYGAYAPTTELALHRAAFEARSDAAVCLHLHPPMATLLHAAGLPIRCITTDHAYYLRRLGTVPFIQPGSDALARAVAAELADAEVAECPPEFLAEVVAQETAGAVYGRGAGSSSADTGETDGA